MILSTHLLNILNYDNDDGSNEIYWKFKDE